MVRLFLLKILKSKIIDMAITEDEIKKDFERFIRHEAMRANTTQDEILRIATSRENLIRLNNMNKY